MGAGFGRVGSCGFIDRRITLIRPIDDDTLIYTFLVTLLLLLHILIRSLSFEFLECVVNNLRHTNDRLLLERPPDEL